jgi:4-aminobutyrate aminotransferase-like enzyme/Ser/Thr protein kinase RdoA (MazF antagonist)
MQIALENLQQLLRKEYGLEGTLQSLTAEKDLNYRLHTEDGKCFVVKIAHEGEEEQLLEMQHALLRHVARQAGELMLPSLMPTISGAEICRIQDKNGRSRMMRVLSWLEGDLWVNVCPHGPELLDSLGEACGEICRRLSDFDHAAAHRSFKWNLSEALWIKDELYRIERMEDLELVEYFVDLYTATVLPQRDELRKGVIYNDANDYNIIVGGEQNHTRRVVGLIDFGDVVYSEVVNELAIAIAYACMGKEDFLAAARSLIRGFHRRYALNETELLVLFPLIAIRLCVSVVNSAVNREEARMNTYLLVSEDAAWAMLRRLREIPPALAHYVFRDAAGFEACPARVVFDRWCEDTDPAALLPALGPATLLDLSVSSTALGSNDIFEDVATFSRKVDEMLAADSCRLGIGGYGEVRPFYTSDAYSVAANDGYRWRSVHLGLDLWAASGTPVYAPWEGKVHSFQDNANDNDYGPTIILEHSMGDGQQFYTLYGHLSRIDLPSLQLGQQIHKGDCIAHIGSPPENGNWPPHLHFQIILDMLGKEGDFPGVAFPEEAAVWLRICPNPSNWLRKHYPVSERAASASSLLERRRRCLAPNLSLSYWRPLQIVRGFGSYLYDETARRYLDTVNNVAHLGHQHPAVVRAISGQQAVLNTNTRYLHSHIIDFAEELLATFPPPLSVCYFVNSGSEANELAIRLARTYSGQRDMLVMESGYHGNTLGCVEISSYKFDGKGGSGRSPYTHVLPVPDTYRGPWKGEEAAGKYAAYTEEIIGSLQVLGRKPAGFIAESILSCAGQIPLPVGYLAEVYKRVRSVGGLCIADEVQVGMGRTGKSFWGFGMQGVVPDIVTLGKPVGNGHPLGVVVTTRDIAEAFDNGMEYFNTYGGNPVSCAAGLAVLRVVQEESLQEHALQLGEYLKKGLQDLQQQYGLLGDIRGEGLFLGIEMIKETRDLAPATAEADYLINRMREKGVLMSTDGPRHNVIKIKPPMSLTFSQADFMLEQLGAVLKEIRKLHS